MQITCVHDIGIQTNIYQQLYTSTTRRNTARPELVSQSTRTSSKLTSSRLAARRAHYLLRFCKKAFLIPRASLSSRRRSADTCPQIVGMGRGRCDARKKAAWEKGREDRRERNLAGGYSSRHREEREEGRLPTLAKAVKDRARDIAAWKTVRIILRRGGYFTLSIAPQRDMTGVKKSQSAVKARRGVVSPTKETRNIAISRSPARVPRGDRACHVRGVGIRVGSWSNWRFCVGTCKRRRGWFIDQTRECRAPIVPHARRKRMERDRRRIRRMSIE